MIYLHKILPLFVSPLMLVIFLLVLGIFLKSKKTEVNINTNQFLRIIDLKRCLDDIFMHFWISLIVPEIQNFLFSPESI